MALDEELVQEWQRRWEDLSPEERALVEAELDRARRYGERIDDEEA